MSFPNFFSALPLDAAFVINSRLSALTLYNQCRLINKHHGCIATLSLLMKQDADAVAYQKKLLNNLLKPNTNYLIKMANSSEKNSIQLINSLLMLLKNPFLELKNKAQALLIISKLKGINFFYPTDIVQKYESELEKYNPECEFVLSSLSSLVPSFSEEDLKRLTMLVSSKIDGMLSPELHTMLPKVKFKDILDLESFLPLTPYLQPHELSNILMVIKNNIIDGSMLVEASKCLKMFAPYLQPTEICEAFLEIKDGLTKQSAERFLITMEHLAWLTPYLLPAILRKTLLEVKDKLIDENECIRASTLECITEFAPHLSPKELSMLFLEVKARLMEESEMVRHSALNCLVAFAPYLQPPELRMLLPDVKKEIMGENKDTYEGIFSYLVVFTPHMHPTELRTLFLDLKAKLIELSNEDKFVPKTAFSWLALCAPHLQPTELNMLFFEVKAKLDINGESIENTNALEFLHVLAPYLPPTELREILFKEIIKNNGKWPLELSLLTCYLPAKDSSIWLPDLAVRTLEEDLLRFDDPLLKIFAAFVPYLSSTELNTVLLRLKAILTTDIDTTRDIDRDIKSSSQIEALRWLAVFAPYLLSPESITMLPHVRAKLADKDITISKEAFRCLTILITNLTLDDQKEFIIANINVLENKEYQEELYHLINCLISQKNRKDNEIIDILRLFEGYDLFLDTFSNNFSNLLTMSSDYDVVKQKFTTQLSNFH